LVAVLDGKGGWATSVEAAMGYQLQPLQQFKKKERRKKAK